MTGPVGIHIGSDQDTVIFAAEAVLAILREPREEQTIQKALEVFDSRCKVENVSVSNCNIQMGVKDFELEEEE